MANNRRRTKPTSIDYSQFPSGYEEGLQRLSAEMAKSRFTDFTKISSRIDPVYDEIEFAYENQDINDNLDGSPAKPFANIGGRTARVKGETNPRFVYFPELADDGTPKKDGKYRNTNMHIRITDNAVYLPSIGAYVNKDSNGNAFVLGDDGTPKAPLRDVKMYIPMSEVNMLSKLKSGGVEDARPDLVKIPEAADPNYNENFFLGAGKAFVGGTQHAYYSGKAFAGALTGDTDMVLEAQEGMSKIMTSQEQRRAQEDIARRLGSEEYRKSLGFWGGLYNGIKAFSAQAVENPNGFFDTIMGMVPMGIGLGVVGAGATAATVATGGGFFAVGVAQLATMYGANTLLMGGAKAIEAASDGSYSKEEGYDAVKKGAIKALPYVGVDLLTMGITSKVMSMPTRAVERAAFANLVKNGVNPSEIEAGLTTVRQAVTARHAAAGTTNRAIIQADMETSIANYLGQSGLSKPQLVESTQEAMRLALNNSNKIMSKLPRAAIKYGSTSLLLGAGEYAGELAAEGHADPSVAVEVAFTGLGMTVAHVKLAERFNRIRKGSTEALAPNFNNELAARIYYGRMEQVAPLTPLARPAGSEEARRATTSTETGVPVGEMPAGRSPESVPRVDTEPPTITVSVDNSGIPVIRGLGNESFQESLNRANVLAYRILQEDRLARQILSEADGKPMTAQQELLYNDHIRRRDYLSEQLKPINEMLIANNPEPYKGDRLDAESTRAYVEEKQRLIDTRYAEIEKKKESILKGRDETDPSLTPDEVKQIERLNVEEGFVDADSQALRQIHEDVMESISQEPSPKVPRIQPEARSLAINKLNETFFRDGVAGEDGRPIFVRAATQSEIAQGIPSSNFINAIGDAVGVDVVYTKGGNGIYEGVYAPNSRRVVFLDVDANGKTPNLNILFHEFGHKLEKNPETRKTYERIKSLIFEKDSDGKFIHLNEDAYNKFLEKTALIEQNARGVDREQAIRIAETEAISEILGSASNTEAFVKSLSQKDAQRFKGMVTEFIEYINNVVNKIKERYGKTEGELMTKDLDALATKLAEIIAEIPPDGGRPTTEIQRLSYKRPEEVVKSEKFMKWFEGSKVVDEKTGLPMVMYHGTRSAFENFSLDIRPTHGASYGYGLYFTSDPRQAGAFAGEQGGNIIPTYLNIKNPLEIDGFDLGLYKAAQAEGKPFGIGKAMAEGKINDNFIKQYALERFTQENGFPVEITNTGVSKYEKSEIDRVTKIFNDRLNDPEYGYELIQEAKNEITNMINHIPYMDGEAERRIYAAGGFDGIHVRFPNKTNWFIALDPNQVSNEITGKIMSKDAEGGALFFKRSETEESAISPERDRLKPLEGIPQIKGATGPDKDVVSVVDSYVKKYKIPYQRQKEYVKVNEKLSKQIADAYENMKDDPTNPVVKEAYEDFIRQTRNQYDELKKAGYRFKFYDSKSDPYGGNPFGSMRDIRNNKEMSVYGTYDGYGEKAISPEQIKKNPMLVDTGLRWPDQQGVMHPVTANDLFRAVHDVLGHGIEGAGFRAQGEENAWQAHARLYEGPAIAAMTSETRGQNSWLNYNNKPLRSIVGDSRAKELHPDNWETITTGEHNQTAKISDTIFAEQKVGLMPEWAWKEGISLPSSKDGKPDGSVKVEEAKRGEVSYKRAEDEGPNNKIKALQEAIIQREAGELTQKEYNQKVKELAPVKLFSDVPTIPSYDEIRGIVRVSQAGKVESPIGEDGRPIRTRIDIPAYNASGKYVVAVHDPSNKNIIISYEPFIALDGPITFGINKEAALKIGKGEKDKFPMSYIDGKYKAASKDQIESMAKDAMSKPDEWVQVGIDPRRHSYAYDRVSQDPITGAEEVIQIGGLVLAKNVTYATPEQRESIVYKRTERPTQRFVLDEAKKKEFIYHYSDAFVDMKDLVKKSGQRLSYENDPAANLVQSPAKARTQNRKFREDFARAVYNATKNNGVTQKELSEFLHYDHATERNIQIQSVGRKSNRLEDGGSGLTEKEIRKYFNGLTEEKRNALSKAAKEIRKFDEETLELKYRYGLITDVDYANIKRAYKKHVPLMRIMPDEMVRDLRAGKARTGTETTTQRAKGSLLEVSDVINNIMADREYAINQIEKNKIAKSVWNFLNLEAKRGVDTSDFGVAIDPYSMTNADKAKMVTLLDKYGLTESEISSVLSAIESEAIDARDAVPFRRPSGILQSSNILFVRDGNKFKYVVLNGRSEEAVRFSQQLKILKPTDPSKFVNGMAGLTRAFTGLNTTNDPTFPVRNFVLDSTGMVLNLSDTPLKNKVGAVYSNMPNAIKEIWQYSMNKSKKKTGTKLTEVQKLYEELMEFGGTHHWNEILETAEKRSQYLAEEIKALERGENLSIVEFLKAVHEANQDASENAGRLSVYMEMRKLGYTQQESAKVAKEISIDFDTSGATTRKANKLYAFLSASVGGQSRTLRAIGSTRGKQIVSGLVGLGVLQAFMLAATGLDDEIPEWEQRNNFIIPTGGKTYMKIKVRGLAPFLNIGRVSTQLATGDVINTSEKVGGLFSSFRDMLDPFGQTGSFLQTITPTIFRPVVSLLENKNWTGEKLYNEKFTNEDVNPAYTRAKRKTTAASIALSEFLNNHSGGSPYLSGKIDIPPEVFDSIVSSYGGGYGRIVSQIKRAAEEKRVTNLPVIREVAGAGKPEQMNTTYYYNIIKEINRLDKAKSGYEEDGNDYGLTKFKKENPQYKHIEDFKKDINEIKVLEKKARASGSDEERTKAQKKADGLKAKLVENYRKKML